MPVRSQFSTSSCQSDIIRLKNTQIITKPKNLFVVPRSLNFLDELIFRDSVPREGNAVGNLPRVDEDSQLIPSFDVQQDQIGASSWSSADYGSPAVGIVRFLFQGKSKIAASVSGEAELVQSWTVGNEGPSLSVVARAFIDQRLGEDHFGVIDGGLGR